MNDAFTRSSPSWQRFRAVFAALAITFGLSVGTPANEPAILHAPSSLPLHEVESTSSAMTVDTHPMHPTTNDKDQRFRNIRMRLLQLLIERSSPDNEDEPRVVDVPDSAKTMPVMQTPSEHGETTSPSVPDHAIPGVPHGQHPAHPASDALVPGHEAGATRHAPEAAHAVVASDPHEGHSTPPQAITEMEEHHSDGHTTPHAAPEIGHHNLAGQGSHLTGSMALPAEPVDRLALADSLIGSGDPVLALTAYLSIDAATLSPTDQTWRTYQLASCHRRLHDLKAASEHYRAVQQQDESSWLGVLARWWLETIEKRQKLAADGEALARQIETMTTNHDAPVTNHP